MLLLIFWMPVTHFSEYLRWNRYNNTDNIQIVKYYGHCIITSRKKIFFRIDDCIWAVFVLVFMLLLCFFQHLRSIQCYVQKGVEQWAEGGESVCTIYQSTGALAFCNRVEPFRNGKRTVSVCSRTLTERISKASFAFPMYKNSKEYLLRHGSVA